MVGGNASHADAVQQVIFIAVSGTENQCRGTHDTAVGGAVAARIHRRNACLNGIERSHGAGSDIFLSNRITFHDPAGKGVCRIFDSNGARFYISTGQIQVLFCIVGNTAVRQFKVSVRFAGIQQSVDFRINLVNGLLGHEFGGHTQRIADRKGFQYAFQHSQAISLSSNGRHF